METQEQDLEHPHRINGGPTDVRTVTFGQTFAK